MAKIVVLANGADATAVSTALDAASVDYEVVDPTPSNLLNIVIGMVDDDDDKKDKPKKDKKDDDKADDKDAPPADADADTPPDDSDIASDASGVEESVGFVKIDGESIKAVKSNATASILYVPKFSSGAKTTYSINESTFSFWPADASAPSQRMIVERANHRASVEISVRQGKGDVAYLAVGADLADLFMIK